MTTNGTRIVPDGSTLVFTARRSLAPTASIWASDHPHPDAKFPGVVDELREATEELNVTEQGRIMGRNSAELYHLPLP